MFYTGFADEAANSLERQLEATKALGWKHIEVRMIDRIFLGKMTDEQFDKVLETMSNTDVTFNCYGSGVANWNCPPLDEEAYQATKKELLVSIPRMQKLGIKQLRGMSFKVDPRERVDSPEQERFIFDKVNELVSICKDAGIVYGHENCMNYGGQSWFHACKLLDHVKHDNFMFIFDTGNPTFLQSRMGLPPYDVQNAWEFYTHVRERIGYVHIKDSVTKLNEDGSVKEREFTYAGDGHGFVPEILTDLFKRGYDGGFSMEPHIQSVFHEGDDTNDEALKEQRKFETYIEYGKRFEALVAKCKAAAAAK